MMTFPEQSELKIPKISLRNSLISEQVDRKEDDVFEHVILPIHREAVRSLRDETLHYVSFPMSGDPLIVESSPTVATKKTIPFDEIMGFYRLIFNSIVDQARTEGIVDPECYVHYPNALNSVIIKTPSVRIPIDEENEKLSMMLATIAHTNPASANDIGELGYLWNLLEFYDMQWNSNQDEWMMNYPTSIIASAVHKFFELYRNGAPRIPFMRKNAHDAEIKFSWNQFGRMQLNKLTLVNGRYELRFNINHMYDQNTVTVCVNFQNMEAPDQDQFLSLYENHAETVNIVSVGLTEHRKGEPGHLNIYYVVDKEESKE